MHMTTNFNAQTFETNTVSGLRPIGVGAKGAPVWTPRLKELIFQDLTPYCFYRRFKVMRSFIRSAISSWPASCQQPRDSAVPKTPGKSTRKNGIVVLHAHRGRQERPCLWVVAWTAGRGVPVPQFEEPNSFAPPRTDYKQFFFINVFAGTKVVQSSQSCTAYAGSTSQHMPFAENPGDGIPHRPITACSLAPAWAVFFRRR